MMPNYHGLPEKCLLVTKNCPHKGNVKTQFISILSNSSRYTAKRPTGMVTGMCTTTISTLTFASLLHDPLILMVMRSDNVSVADQSELLLRVQETLIARSSLQEPTLEATV